MPTLKTVTAAAVTALALALPACGQDGTAAGAVAPQATTEESEKVELAPVEVTSRPMVYVTARSSMDPQEIERLTGSAFETLGKFLAETQVTPLGPPLSIYGNWDGGQMTVDVGFPVSAADAQKARGDVLSGSTPSGHALKAIHLGPYDGLADTYKAIEAQMQSAGVAPSGMSWEIYLNEPGVVPDAELLTEIYMQVSAEDAAKLQAK